jgi:hypothetical protein
MDGRLWANFATPQRAGRYARAKVSTHKLDGISCRGFALSAGGERGSSSELLFEAQRQEDGTWRFGPESYLYPYCSDRREREWEAYVREREGLRYDTKHRPYHPPEHYEARIAELTAKIAAHEAETANLAAKHDAHQRLRQRVYELAQARVLDFIGAPDAQMPPHGCADIAAAAGKP